MVVRSSWAELTAGLSPADLALLRAYRDMCRGLEGAQEEVHTSAVQYRMKRIRRPGNPLTPEQG